MKTQLLSSKKGTFSAKIAEFVVPAILMLQTVSAFAQEEQSKTIEDAKKAAEESQFMFYLLVCVGVAVIIAFSYFTTVRKNKNKDANIGYRKQVYGGHHHHRHHRVHRSSK